MRERGIIMTGESVRAIMAGSKTQTRRILKPQPECRYIAGYGIGRPGHPAEWQPCMPKPDLADWRAWASRAETPWHTSDRLWVREAWAHDAPDLDACRRGVESDGMFYGPYYRATASDFDVSSLRWRPPTHMPRWASRLTLTVTDVRVRRLDDMTDADARAEGITDGGCCRCGDPEPCGCSDPQPVPKDAFIHRWNTIHGKDAWDLNPWVAAISFTPADRTASEGGA